MCCRCPGRVRLSCRPYRRQCAWLRSPRLITRCETGAPTYRFLPARSNALTGLREVLALAVLAPELIRNVEVRRIKPDFGGLAIADVNDLDNTVFQPPAGPFTVGREQRNRMLVVGNDIVHLKAESAAGELEGPAKHR